MSIPFVRRCVLFFCLVSSTLFAQFAPNAHPIYQALRTGGFGQEAYSVQNLLLKRGGATLKLDGKIWLLGPVNNKHIGLAFTGTGILSVTPPTPSEQRQLRLFSRDVEFVEHFDEMMLFFTDNTYDEVKAAGQPDSSPAPAGVLSDARKRLRDSLRYNLYGRLQQDVMAQQPGGLFFAMIKGKHYSGKMLFVVDPHGVPSIDPLEAPPLDVAPEEVAVTVYDEMHGGVWTAYYLPQEYMDHTAKGTQKNDTFFIEHQDIDATMEKSGKLDGVVKTTIISNNDELNVVRFELFTTLRVSKVVDSSGNAMHFMQEDKEHDAQFYVVLPHALKMNEKFDIVTTYSGKDAIRNEGGDNYYPLARDNWYPNKPFGEYETYDMKFHIPKGMTMVATGIPVSSGEENGWAVSVWKSAVPQAVAGFNFGRFKKDQAQLKTRNNFQIESYTNINPPDIVQAIQHAAEPGMSLDGSHGSAATLGTMDTRSFGPKALAEAEMATDLYWQYFGPIPYQRLAMTQQTASNYGQAWPGLVYLPITYFFDTTVRHQLGMSEAKGYFRIVASHEVAHQWWGHAVGFKSYRDQWMSEGFAECSASIYTQMVNKKPDEFRKFWSDEHELLVQKNKEGVRPIDVGPVTLGYRLLNGRTGYDVPRRLIYPKGAYILHMVRMMMWNSKSGDELFQKMMTDFVQTHYNNVASTEDFKTAVEKYMTQGMDVDGNHTMDWFFNEYVYGTALPAYSFESSFVDGPNGTTLLKFKLTQSKVDDAFDMIVPVYIELPNGHVPRLGSIGVRGNNSVEQTVNLGPLKERPKRALINWNYDVLSE
ncbi:Aminopeptidase N-like protein [Candidatus Koribacter versatilis Ellin345]|uniref:Aminopeptidase N-like protein n=1 Tax=Koribacter versatilis (strain Ellin345) TaxID=204669 RepID=Q1IPH0_KORVE|nr:M1 family aminopeptidase [Candidatus Koribacter versatilis]ABF41230.1 Aminopeptidase N-like protein [Candidatus Koribacter versatilis Ellin345]